MRERMGQALWEEWLVWMREHPIGPQAADVRLAYQLAVLGNIVGGGKLVGKTRRVPYTTKEFLLNYRPSKKKTAVKRMSSVDSNAYIMGIFASLGMQRPGASPQKQPEAAP